MIAEPFDLAILGSGFAGSLLAMIARRLGYSVLLLERGRHPRFAIGESSTPLANLLLEELARQYDLPQLLPLTKWGTWQRERPELACGLKRGFTFLHHGLGCTRPAGLEQSLLVAASPRDEIADTHWFRESFDAFFVKQAQALGVHFVEGAQVQRIERADGACILGGEQDGVPTDFKARFIVDATGPRGALHRLLGLRESTLAGMPETELLYTHFSDVETLAATHADFAGKGLPYPAEDAAVHHVFDGGWIWVLRFNNGVTSAGVAATTARARALGLARGEEGWRQLLQELPAVQSVFASAKALRGFVHVPHACFLAESAAGEGWAMLPSAASFIDPLLSTGFPLTLLGVQRLARLLAKGSHLAAPAQAYAQQTRDEAMATGTLIGALYATMGNFNAFAALCLIYFAAASFAETARRLRKPELAPGFLLCNHPVFAPSFKTLCTRAHHLRSPRDTSQFVQDVMRTIEPFDVAGLTDRKRGNLYPVLAEDLLESAYKVGASNADVRRMLAACGMAPAEPTTVSAAPARA